MIATFRPLQLIACTPATPSRPLFVFLPGMDGSGVLLQPQVAGLSSGFDIHCLSIPPDDLKGWDELTEQVAALIRMEQQRHPGRTTTVCGESFGGCLALKLITRFPNLCDRLILVNPASSAQRQPWIGACSSVTHLLPAPIYHLSALSLCNLLIASHRVSRPTRLQLLAAMQAVRPQSAAWRMALLTKFRLEDLPLDRVHQPVLILASEADRLLPSQREAKRLAGFLPNTTIVLLPDSGHACLLEDQLNLSAILQSQNLCPELLVSTLPMGAPAQPAGLYW
ncbi:alpha/beta fold hydrolase [Cyanobium sp. HWJ4-Hawea]|uniref:alpha/beta fold hydrolase n=1 Tax=Cyanobium sp. HWJ4-Hawea TaxID=2823713 RepID=UPI0020CF3DCF|nr:alpha/beta fold hydrolase [Cyanobium sp. HWJ4-Hawea]MCP9809255.1 alpha/beta fold hydrolase [Cyanobium sp. HWJ4-Hawea]